MRLFEVSNHALLCGVCCYLDHRRLLDDKSIDAVIMATPQHLLFDAGAALHSLHWRR